jgi:uncharacterized membrane protein
MNTENPYAAGEAAPGFPAEVSETIELLQRPESNGAGAGFDWIKAGFGDFKRGPFAHVGFLVLLFVAGTVISLVSNFGFLIDPAFGFVVNMGASLAMNLVMFLLVAGFLLAVRQSRALGFVRFETFFAGFSHPRAGALLGLGGLYLLLTLIISAGAFVGLFLAIGPEAFGDFFVSTWMSPYGSTGTSSAWLADEDTLIALAIAGAVMGALIFIVVGMFFFFSAHLVTFGDVGAVEALKLSFFGCLRNIVPLFLWSLSALVLFIVGTIPCGLGLLVVVPMVWASTYQAFLDIFTDVSADSLSAPPAIPPTI